MGFLGIGGSGKKAPSFDPYSDVKQAQDLNREAVTGYGEQLRPGLEREIGNALGGLNSIGALRSGGANAALTDITTRYADQVGAYAKQAAGESTSAGLEAGRLREAHTARLDAKKASLWKAVGGVLGAGVGFLASGGNPLGAVSGYKAGSSAGGAIDKTQSSGQYSDRFAI